MVALFLFEITLQILWWHLNEVKEIKQIINFAGISERLKSSINYDDIWLFQVKLSIHSLSSHISFFLESFVLKMQAIFLASGKYGVTHLQIDNLGQ